MDNEDGHGERFEREELIRALQARERFLTGVLGSLESFVTIDDAWRITFANETAARMAGAPAEQLIGVDVRELTPPELLEQSQQALLRALQDQVVVEFRAEMPGNESSFRGRAYPLADGGLAVYLRDVTEEVKAALVREETEERYHELVESVNSAILRWTSEGIITFANEYAERLFGWEAGQLLGRHVNVLLADPDVDTEGAVHLVEDILARPEQHVTHVNENVRKDGTRLWVAWTNRVLRDARGGISEVLTIGNDITELSRTQSALREAEQRYRTIVELANEGILMTDLDGVYTFVNPRMAEMLGYEVEEMLGKTTADFTFEEEHATIIERRRGLSAGQTSGEFRWRRRDGSELWTHYSGTLVVNEAGEHTGNLGIHTDITERRRSEAALLRTEAEKAAQRERMRLARDLHDSVTQALFAATLKAEALVVSEDTARVNAIAEEVRRLSRGSLAQMRTLLLELRGDPLEEVPIAQLLRNLVEATESRASLSVWLSLDCEAELPPALHVAVYRITQEALNNVARHADAANAWVELRSDSAAVSLTVRDDGRGFDDEPRDPSHLGLTLMRERAEEVGGSLTLETGGERGTLVRFDWKHAEAGD